ncbi:MAG: DNA cytosine methyltransferase [Candidatus Cloacimonetes bacterium]|nr:DNA cytosine methyltransferase [Candidatus Cloacimonadota bacterium]
MNKYALSVIDLFAGCGGLSEGFREEGFEIVSQLEMDKWACETLKTRQLYYNLKKRGKLYWYNKYLTDKLSKEDLYNKFPNITQIIKKTVIHRTIKEDNIYEIIKNIKKLSNKIHVLLGGPPCQPYSLAGRSRDPNRKEKDSRHYLYRYYLKFLEKVKPDFFVYENVPGLFTAKINGESIFHKLLIDFQSLNPSYKITPPLEMLSEKPNSYILNSSDFFVPQSRKRLILIGYRESLEKRDKDIERIFSLIQEKGVKNKNHGCLTIDDAIGDLPPLQPGEGNDGWYMEYPNHDNLKKYQISLRKKSPGVINHKARTHMQSDLERYKFFIEHHKNGNSAATLEDLIAERPDLIPNHKHLDKFIDRFKVQWWNRPSSTITAHISKDGHYYIHPEISQCRSFTVREAARCQSFPDNFKFEGPRTDQFRQVGNAVPPKLANVIAKYIRKELSKIYGH